jgi:hypothetical protein
MVVFDLRRRLDFDEPMAAVAPEQQIGAHENVALAKRRLEEQQIAVPGERGLRFRERGGEVAGVTDQPALGIEAPRDFGHAMTPSVNDYDDVLMFALHRFVRVKVADGKVRRPKGFELASFLKDGWAHYGTGKSMRLDVRFTPEAAEHLTETPLSEDQKLGDDADGRVRLRARVCATGRCPRRRTW